MALSRDKLPKEMTPFGKGAKKAKPFGGSAPKANPFAVKDEKDAKKGKKPFGFAGGGVIPAYDTPTHKAATNSNPPSKNPLDDGKPSGGGTARGGGAATKGKKFRGTF